MFLCSHIILMKPCYILLLFFYPVYIFTSLSLVYHMSIRSTLHTRKKNISSTCTLPIFFQLIFPKFNERKKTKIYTFIIILYCIQAYLKTIYEWLDLSSSSTDILFLCFVRVSYCAYFTFCYNFNR